MTFIKIITEWVGRLLAFLNVVAAIAMCAVSYAHLVSPAKYANTELLALVFPLPLAVCLAFLLFWLLANRKMCLISLAALLVCWGPIRDYCPVNLPSSAPKDCLTIMSFNVYNFPGCNTMSEKADTMIAYLSNSGADILCLQETAHKNEDIIDERMSNAGYHHVAHHIRDGAEHIAVYSKYPILWDEEIPIDSKYNICAAVCVDVNGKPLLLMNCHLESFSFHHWEKKAIQNMLERKNKLDDKHKRKYLGKVLTSARKRAAQADVLAQYIREHRDMSIVLCGDFNDPPNSYAYHQIAKELNNCYRRRATGPGFTYNRGGLYFRIDNIFCSSDIETYTCEIDAKTNISDHYPIVCKVKMAPKP